MKFVIDLEPIGTCQEQCDELIEELKALREIDSNGNVEDSKYNLGINASIAKLQRARRNNKQVQLYKAEGFNTLVFDNNGITKLTPLDDVLSEEYAKYESAIQDKVWATANRLINQLHRDELIKIGLVNPAFEDTQFERDALESVFTNSTYSEVQSLLDKYDQAVAEAAEATVKLEVGDIVSWEYEDDTLIGQVTTIFEAAGRVKIYLMNLHKSTILKASECHLIIRPSQDIHESL